MIFYDKQSKEEQNSYQTYLRLMGSLSRLFSENQAPYLDYRIAENIFCKAFVADNLSRSDCSVDARKNNMGIGLKTFLAGNGKTFQKIAEFNSDRKYYSEYIDNPDKFIEYISKLRNERIAFTKRTYDISDAIYHCVIRNKNSLLLYETSMDLVDIDSLKNEKISKASISFKDKYNKYRFDISKSTLFKQFITPIKNTIPLPIEIINDPLEILLKLYDNSVIKTVKDETEFVILPLYSTRFSTKDKKVVAKASGLNQWNAKGRERNSDEVYIPIPPWIHKVFNVFFPHRDVDFTLILPNKTEIKASLCQTGDKGLMSNPNKALGDWLLRTVLQLEKNKLVTYEDLEKIGVDSVRIDKINHNTYTINFTEVGSFDDFEEENKL